MLVLAAILIAVIKASNTDIIGGADMPTLIFAFSSWKGGLCSVLAFLGICSVIASVAVKIINGKGKNKPETH